MIEELFEDAGNSSFSAKSSGCLKKPPLVAVDS
jgi:hypothetical protein